MQTSRKHSYSLLQKPQSSYLQLTKNSQIKKKCSCTQTDNVGGQQSFDNFINFPSLNEEFQEKYAKAVRFLNCCHESMNKMLIANYKECGDSEPDSSSLFRIPKVPNYFSVLLLFLSKSNQNHVDLNGILNPIKNNNIEVQIESRQPNSECEIIFDKKAKETSDATISLENDSTKLTYSGSAAQQVENISQISSSEASPIQSRLTTKHSNSKSEIANRNTKTEIAKASEEKKSENIQVDNEKLLELIQKQVEEEMSKYINKDPLETVPKSSRNIEDNKSSEATLEKKTTKPTNMLSQNSLLRYVQKEFSEFLGQIELPKKPQLKDVAIQKSQIEVNYENNAGETKVGNSDNSLENVDLLEYSFRKLRKNVIADKAKQNFYKMTFSECKLGRQKSCCEDENERIPSGDFQNSGKNFANRKSSSSSSVSTRNTRKVNEMFQKISKESLHAPKQVSFRNDISQDVISDANNYEDETYFNNDKEEMIGLGGNDDTDSDSIIIEDEDFDRKVTNRQNEAFSTQTLWRTDSFSSHYSAGSTKLKKCHPLQLTKKDLSHADDKMLKTIGIFTTKGFIKPELIDTIEEKEKMFNIRSRKNKQFRTKRKIDFEVQYDPKNGNNSIKQQCNVSVESSLSENSFSLKSAVSYSSAGSISDSD